jgi:hypothetical protein
MRRGSGHERKKWGTRGMSLLIYPDTLSQFQFNVDIFACSDVCPQLGTAAQSGIYCDVGGSSADG